MGLLSLVQLVHFAENYNLEACRVINYYNSQDINLSLDDLNIFFPKFSFLFIDLQFSIFY